MLLNKEIADLQKIVDTNCPNISPDELFGLKKLLEYYHRTEEIFRLSICNDKKSVFYNPKGQTWEEHSKWLQGSLSAAIGMLDGNEDEEDEPFLSSEICRKLKEHLNFHNEIYNENLKLKKSS